MITSLKRSKQTIYLLPILAICTVGCNNKLEGIHLNSVKLNDTVTSEIYLLPDRVHHILNYHKNGNLIEDYYTDGKGVLNGMYKSYYYNSLNIKEEGIFKEGRKVGFYHFYNENGKKSKSIEYIILGDTILSKPNQIIYFNGNEDTIMQYPSLYYSIEKSNDTTDGIYNFKISLIGARYPNSKLIICDDYTEKYILPDTSKCEILDLVNHQLEINKKGNNKGINIIRGQIFNYKYANKKTVDSSLIVYIVDSFYQR